MQLFSFVYQSVYFCKHVLATVVRNTGKVLQIVQCKFKNTMNHSAFNGPFLQVFAGKFWTF